MKGIVTSILLLSGWLCAIAQEEPRLDLLHPSLVVDFYAGKGTVLYWWAPGPEAAGRRRELLALLDSAASRGLDSNGYHRADIGPTRDAIPPRGAESDWDRMYTDAAIAFFRDLYQGAGNYDRVSYDGISDKFALADDRLVMDRLIRCTNAGGMQALADDLERYGRPYQSLRSALRDSLTAGHAAGARQLAAALNNYRWIHHRRFTRYIVVNIPSADLRYYEGDSLMLTMKVVAGQPGKRTPRFAAWCNEVILYPYWNVPRRIVVNELLPMFRKDPTSVEGMNMQLIDDKGRVQDAAGLDWKSYNKNYFPFTVRQSTGCDNALGVIKFNLTDPFDVYMHDTNFKPAFNAAYRYYSHGCIRLEKPFVLGAYLLPGRLDSSFLRACLREQRPRTVALKEPVPVYVVYMTADWLPGDGDKVLFYKDIYHLLP